jgi:hypothetical protein
MGKENEDRFLEQIDAELRSVNRKLKKVFGDAETLLREYNDEGPETQNPEDDDTNGHVEGCDTVEECGNEPVSNVEMSETTG